MGPLTALVHLVFSAYDFFAHVSPLLRDADDKENMHPQRDSFFFLSGISDRVSRPFRDLLPYLVVDFRLVLAQEARIVVSASAFREVDRGRYLGSC